MESKILLLICVDCGKVLVEESHNCVSYTPTFERVENELH